MLRRNFFKLFAGVGAVGISSSVEAKSKQDKQYILGHGDFACELATALGLDPKKTRSIHLNIDVDSAVTADVSQYVTVGEMKELTAIIDRKYVLERIPSEKDILVALGK